MHMADTVCAFGSSTFHSNGTEQYSIPHSKIATPLHSRDRGVAACGIGRCVRLVGDNLASGLP